MQVNTKEILLNHPSKGLAQCVMEWRHCWNFRFITFVSRETFISLVLVLPPSIHRNTFFDNRKHLHGPKTRILIIFVELLRSVANG